MSYVLNPDVQFMEFSPDVLFGILGGFIKKSFAEVKSIYSHDDRVLMVFAFKSPFKSKVMRIP